MANKSEIKVLIADDLPSARSDLTKILNTMGFTQIFENQDGKSAWDNAILEAQYGKAYNLMFLDINMPQLNGIQLLKNLRNVDVYKKIPIIMVSTQNEKDIIIKCIIEGATDYVLKPFNIETVMEKVNKIYK